VVSINWKSIWAKSPCFITWTAITRHWIKKQYNDFMEFHTKYYSPEKMKLVLIGPFALNVMKDYTSMFSSWLFKIETSSKKQGIPYALMLPSVFEVVPPKYFSVWNLTFPCHPWHSSDETDFWSHLIGHEAMVRYNDVLHNVIGICSFAIKRSSSEEEWSLLYDFTLMLGCWNALIDKIVASIFTYITTVQNCIDASLTILYQEILLLAVLCGISLRKMSAMSCANHIGSRNAKPIQYKIYHDRWLLIMLDKKKYQT
jgi:secreted Zn-dependent insulinase-like peptidase